MSVVQAQIIYETDVYLNAADMISIVNKKVENIETGNLEDVIVTFPLRSADDIIQAIQNVIEEAKKEGLL